MSTDPSDGVAYCYAISVRKRLKFPLTLPGTTAGENRRLAPVIERIMVHAQYASREK